MKITSKSGHEFQLSFGAEKNHIFILGTAFYLAGNQLKNHGDTSSFCRSMGIDDCNVNIDIDEKTADEIRYTIFPEKKKVKLIRTFEDFDVHFTGETWKKVEEWEMADGTLKQFTIAKREF